MSESSSIPAFKGTAKHQEKQGVANKDKGYPKQVRQDMFGFNG